MYLNSSELISIRCTLCAIPKYLSNNEQMQRYGYTKCPAAWAGIQKILPLLHDKSFVAAYVT